MGAHRIVLLCLCLAFTGNGRRVHKEQGTETRMRQPTRQVGQRSPSESIAALLQNDKNTAAFQAAGMGPRRGRIVRDHVANRATLLSPRFARGPSERSSDVLMAEEKVEDKVEEKKPADPSCDCTIDNLEACSQEELELLYVDALWAFYEEGTAALSDEQYNKLVTELNWQGSGFPSLRRNEIAFVKAALAFARGEAIVSDEKWESMKAEIKGSTGKRREVTEFLLYTRSLRETAATRERLFEEMASSGIAVSVTAAGVSCTLSNVPNTLSPNVKDVFEMYLALTAIPTALSLLGWVIIALFLEGPAGLVNTASPGIPIAGFVSYLITRALISYVELAQPELLEGQCPCCEEKIGYMSTSFNDREPKLTCGNCKTDLVLDCDAREIGKAGGLNVIGATDAESKTKWTDDILSRNLLKGISDLTLGLPNEKTQLGPPGKAAPNKIPKDMTKLRYVQENLDEGLFAWAILAGYAIFGEQFIVKVRGKGISLHSQAITSFSNRYFIPPKMRQQYVQTAKRNGEDLGFLVKPPNLWKDGLIGKQALAWWKAQGF